MNDIDPAVATDPVLAALTRIEARLDRLESRLEGVGDLAAETPATIATAVDGLDETVARLAARGVDVDERLRELLALTEKLTDPATLASVGEAVDVLQSLPGTAATIADTFDGVVGQLAEMGVDVDERMRVVVQVAERLTAPEALAVVTETFDHVDAIGRLLRSGIFAPAAVDVVDRAAGSLAAMNVEGARPVGALGALRALSDPCIQRSLGALVEFGRHFGRTVNAREKDGSLRTGPCPE